MKKHNRVISLLMISSFCWWMPLSLFADENNMDELPPANYDCIPNVALPIFPESESCASYIEPAVDETTSADTSASNNTTTTTDANASNNTAPATTTTVSSSSTVYYYPMYPNYYPYNYNNATSGVFLGLVTGLAIGGLFYAINHDNGNYYNYYYNNYFNNYYYHNNGYRNAWHGDYVNAGYYHGPNGGAYYWNGNNHEGGGYCYQGSCHHNNDWNANNVKKADVTPTTHANISQHAETHLTHTNYDRNMNRLPSEHFNVDRPQNFHFEGRGGFGGFHGGRR